VWLWVLMGFAGLVVAAVVAFDRLTSPARIRAIVEARLAEICRGSFKIGSARLSIFDNRLEIHGVEIRSTDPEFADLPAVAIVRIRAGLDLWTAVFGGDVLRSVEVSDIELNRIESADGRSNFSGLFAPPKSETASAGRPSLSIRSGRARTFRSGPGHPPLLEVETPRLDVDLTPDVRRGGFYAVRVAAPGTPLQPVFGSVRVNGPFRAELTAGEVPLCPELIGCMPPRLRHLVSSFAPTGRPAPEGRLTDISALVDVERSLMTFRASYDRLSGVVPTYRLRGVPAEAAPPQAPQTANSDYAYVSQAAGAIEFGGTQLAVNGRALVNGREAEFQAAFHGLDQPAVGMRVSVKVPHIDARESLWRYRDLNRGLSAVIEEIEPQATASVELLIEREAGGRIAPSATAAWNAAAALVPGLPLLPTRELTPQPEISGNVEIRDGSIREKWFPYLVENVRGRIEFGRGSADLTFQGGKAPTELSVVGRLIWNEGPSMVGNLLIRGRNLPLDDALRRAIDPAVAKTYEELAPSGQCDFLANVILPDAFTRDVSVFAELHLDGRADFTLPEPPLRVRGASGTVAIDIEFGRPARARVYNVRGETAGGRLNLTGEFGADRRRRPQFWVEFDAQDVLLCPELDSLLTEQFRARFRALKLNGRFDPVGRVYRQADTPVGYDIAVNLRNLTAAPAELPRPLERGAGRLHIRPEGLELTGFTGKMGAADVKVDAVIRTVEERRGGPGRSPAAAAARAFLPARSECPAGSGRFELHAAAAGLELDRNLREAVGPTVRRYWDMLRPEGSLDALLRISGELKDGAEHRIEADLTARGMSMRPTDFPYALTDIRGTVAVRPDEVRFDNVKARHGPAEWTLGGTLRAGKDATQAEFRLGGKKAVLNDELRAALPPAVRDGLRGLDPRGTFDIEVNLAGTAEGGRVSSWQFDGALGVQDGSFSLGRRVEGLHGVIRGRGEFFTETGRWLVAGNFTADRARFIELAGTDVTGRFEKRADGDRLTVIEMKGRTCGGVFGGGAFVELRSNGKYEAKLNADNIELFEFWRGYTGKAASMSGRFRATLAARGSLQGVSDLEMAGDLICRNGRLGETLAEEVTGKRAGKATVPAGAGSFSFDGLSLRYRRRGDNWTFEDIIVEGSGVRLAGRGTLSPKDEVDMIFVVVPPADGAKVPLLGELIRGVTNELVQLRVSGSTAQPRISQRNLDQLGAPLRDLLRTVRPAFVDEKKN
jgi:hypothetical protein